MSNHHAHVTNQYAMQLVDNDRYLLVFNFTPAASVSAIDMESRQVLNEFAGGSAPATAPNSDHSDIAF